MSRTQQCSQAAVQPGPPGPPTRPRGPAYFRSAPYFCLAAAFKGILFDGWYPGPAAKLTPLNHLPHFQATAREVFRGGEADPKSKPKFRSPGEGNGNPLQYSCLENSTDGAAWWVTAHGVAKSRTPLSDFTFTFLGEISHSPAGVFYPSSKSNTGQ